MIRFSGNVQTNVPVENLVAPTRILPVKDQNGKEIGTAIITERLGDFHAEMEIQSPYSETLKGNLDTQGYVSMGAVLDITEERFSFDNHWNHNLEDLSDAPLGSSIQSAILTGLTIQGFNGPGVTYREVLSTPLSSNMFGLEDNWVNNPKDWETNLTWAKPEVVQWLKPYPPQWIDVTCVIKEPLAQVPTPRVIQVPVAPKVNILQDKPVHTATEAANMDMEILTTLRTQSTVGCLMTSPARKLLCLQRLNTLVNSGSIILTPFGYAVK